MHFYIHARDDSSGATNFEYVFGLAFMMTSSNGKHFPRYWPFVRGIHRNITQGLPVNSPHILGQWRGALIWQTKATAILWSASE